MPSPKAAPQSSQKSYFLRATRRAGSLSVLGMRILRLSSWNDDRLDELSRRTDEGFKEINQRLDRLTNTLITIAGGALVAFVGNGILG